MKNLIFFAILSIAVSVTKACTGSLTTVKGTHAPKTFCSGDLIFEENFDTFDTNKWQHAVTMAGGGNYQFNWVVNDRNNTYASGGNLHIRPTLTSDVFGEAFVTSGTVEIPADIWYILSKIETTVVTRNLNLNLKY